MASCTVTSQSPRAEPAPVAQIKVLENVEAPAYEDTWVTVFGFGTDSAATSHVLQEFQSCGNIQMWLSPPLPTCNWLYIQFETQHGAQRALQRNGTKLASMGILVGVQPPSAADRQHIGGRQPGGAASASSQPTLPERGYVLSTTRTKVRPQPVLKSHVSRAAPLGGCRAVSYSQQYFRSH